MGFLNTDKLIHKYTTEPMKGNAERLKEFDAYHYLLAGGMSTSLYVKQFFKNVPDDFLSWSKVCDGGMLFDTTLLSSKEYDAGTDIEFDTYEALNTAEFLTDRKVPEGYKIFAVRSYGDVLCFSENAGDECVYLWDIEEEEFSEIWDTFTDWLTEEIDESLELIAEGILDPLPIKMGGDSDE